MEPNAQEMKEGKRYTVDLSKELSPRELERLRAEAAKAGHSLKAYALALVFSPEFSGDGCVVSDGEAAESFAEESQKSGGQVI